MGVNLTYSQTPRLYQLPPPPAPSGVSKTTSEIPSVFLGLSIPIVLYSHFYHRMNVFSAVLAPGQIIPFSERPPRVSHSEGK